MPKIVAVVPTLNEERGLPAVIAGLKAQHVDEIVVVDGNSTDKTQEIARRNGCTLILQDGKGKGAGFKSFLAKYALRDDDYYMMLDGDASYASEDLPKITALLDAGNDVVSGSRQLHLTTIRDAYHNLGNYLISTLFSLLFWRVADVCTGYWGFKGSALKKLAITADSFDLEADLLTQTMRQGLRFKVTPVTYSPRLGESKLTARHGVKIVKKLVKGRFA